MPKPIGEHDDVPHTLIPLPLAVGLIRAKVYGERVGAQQSRLDALATFVAGTVLLYEFASDSSRAPRALSAAEIQGGLFRSGGRELRFLDGRSPKQHLAVNAVDVECVMALLKDPQRAAATRSRYVRLRSQKLKARSLRVRTESAMLREEAIRLRRLTLRGFPAPRRADQAQQAGAEEPHS